MISHISVSERRETLKSNRSKKSNVVAFSTCYSPDGFKKSHSAFKSALSSSALCMRLPLIVGELDLSLLWYL